MRLRSSETIKQNQIFTQKIQRSTQKNVYDDSYESVTMRLRSNNTLSLPGMFLTVSHIQRQYQRIVLSFRKVDGL